MTRFDRNQNNRNGEDAVITKYFPSVVYISLLIGFSAIIAYSAGAEGTFLFIFARILIVALASASSGWLIGFLFGIPRARPTPTQNQEPSSGENTSTNTSKTTQTSFFQYNNNLSDVSDWLTKILVGVTLTQIGPIRDNFGRIIDFIIDDSGAANISNPQAFKGFIFTVIVYFTGVGIFSGFLWAVYEFAANYKLIQAQTKDLKTQFSQKIDGIEDAFDNDSLLTRLVARQLNIRASEVEQDHLNDAISKATNSCRSGIAWQTIKFRQDWWESDADNAARTIRIFIGLINENSQDYHQTYGELAYAQKDKYNFGKNVNKNDKSLLEEAKENLKNAINLRDQQIASSPEKYHTYYELNLAQCYIQLEDSDNQRTFELLRVAIRSGILTIEFLTRKGIGNNDDILINAAIKQWILDNPDTNQSIYSEEIANWRNEELSEKG